MKDKFYKFMKNKDFKGSKDNQHDYISTYYGPEFENLRGHELRIVEIGVRDGSDLALLCDWFTKSTIIGIDINPVGYPCVKICEPPVCGCGIYYKNVKEFENFSFIKGNAYSDRIRNVFDDNSIDYLIDDGSHLISDQLRCIEIYYPKIKTGGKIIIEDVGWSQRQGSHYRDEIGKVADNDEYCFFCVELIKEAAIKYNMDLKIIDNRKQNLNFSVIIELTKGQK